MAAVVDNLIDFYDPRQLHNLSGFIHLAQCNIACKLMTVYYAVPYIRDPILKKSNKKSKQTCVQWLQ